MKKLYKIAYIAPEECSLVPENWHYFKSLKSVKKLDWQLSELDEYDWILVMGSISYALIKDKRLKYQQAKGYPL